MLLARRGRRGSASRGPRIVSRAAWAYCTECFGVAPLCRVACEAAFDSHRNPTAADRERLAEYRGRAIRSRVWTTAQLGENRHEGTAATISEVRAAAEAAFQTLGDALEKAVSDMAAMGVIDFAQALDVKDDDRQIGVHFGRSAQQLGEVLAESVALGEAGQRVKCQELGCSALIRKCDKGCARPPMRRRTHPAHV